MMRNSHARKLVPSWYESKEQLRCILHCVVSKSFLVGHGGYQLVIAELQWFVERPARFPQSGFVSSLTCCGCIAREIPEKRFVQS